MDDITWTLEAETLQSVLTLLGPDRCADLYGELVANGDAAQAACLDAVATSRHTQAAW